MGSLKRNGVDRTQRKKWGGDEGREGSGDKKHKERKKEREREWERERKRK